MADDIDIEEHDVMDSPIIRSIFPDLSILKKEVLDNYDEASMIEQNVIEDEELSHCNDSENNILFWPSRALEDGNQSTNGFLKCTQISTKSAILDVDDLSVKKHLKNKIILGSKPSKFIQRKFESSNDSELYTAKVMLNNLRPYLDSCKKYCEICCILFPNTELLDIHKQSLHCSSSTDNSKLNSNTVNENIEQSKNICVNKPKCNVCYKTFASQSGLYKHRRNIHFIKTKTLKIRGVKKNRNVANQMTNGKSNITNPTNSCFHCKNSFPNMQSLIEHLYDTLQNKKDTISTQKTKKNLNILFSNKQDNVTKTCRKNEIKKFSLIKNSSKGYNIYFYRCPVCSYYFKNLKRSLSHLLNKHKLKKKAPLKKVLFDPKCKFCLSELKHVKSYNNHLRKVHKKVLLGILKTKPKKSSKLPNAHKEIKLKNDKLYKPTTTPEQIAGENPHSLSNIDICATDGILKSILFRCNRCDIHFIRSQVAIDHEGHMEVLINWKCSQCNRIFKKNDELFHRHQHLATNDFTVYGINEAKPSIILFKCPKCTVHFDENTYLQHFPVCENSSQGHVQCKFCDIFIDISLKSVHEQYHRTKTVNLKDFVFVRTEVIESHVKSLDANSLNVEHRELRTRGKNVNSTYEAQIKKLKSDNMFSVYYCHNCKCFVNNNTKLIMHKKAHCTHVVPATCKLCGLVITQTGISSHGRLHQRKKNLSLQDFNFYDLKTEKLIAPPIPEFPHCNVCGIYFANPIAKIRHECGVHEYITCSYCELNFSELGYKLHMNYHNYRLQLSSSSLSVSKIKAKNVQENEVSNVLETNLYNEGREKFNVYSCKNCHISVDTYDLVVEHCQRHYNPTKIQSSTKVCTVCDLIFDAECYEGHELLHLQNHNKKIFKVIKFDIFYFTTDYDAWVKRVFDSLPQEEVQAIINKSIYRYEHKIKMKVIQEGSSGLIVYKCDKCRCFIDPCSLYKHLDINCLTLRKHTCGTCGIPFISATSKLQHEAIHKQPFKGLKSYKIVLFNRDEDKMFNEALQSENWFTLYKCRNCEGVVCKTDFKNHVCDKSDLKKCSYCGLLLYNREINLHISKHKEFDSFNTTNIKVILIGTKTDECKSLLNSNNLVSSFNGKEYDYSFYRCSKCQVCIRNARSTLKHNCSFEIPKSKCLYCGLLLETSKLKHHYVLHETDCNFVSDNITIIDLESDKSQNGKTNIAKKSCNNLKDVNHDKKNSKPGKSATVLPVTGSSLHNSKQTVDANGAGTEKTAKLYKCSCGLHFLDKSVMVHLYVCSPKSRISRQHCSKCGLTFSPNVLFKHLLTHHGNKDITYKFDVIDVFKDKPIP